MLYIYIISRPLIFFASAFWDEALILDFDD